MRIAFLCTSSIDDASPRGRWLPVARELARMGHEMHLVLLHHTFDALVQRETVIDGVRVVHVAQMHVRGLPGQRRYFSSPELARVAARAARALAGEALRLRPDAVHVCKPQPINGPAGRYAARRLRVPLYVDCDDFEAAANRTSSAAQRAVIRWWEDRLPKLAAGVTVNTRFLFERNRALGVDARRLIHVPNGIVSRPAEAPRPPGAPLVVYVGTLSAISHGVGLLLDAFVRVHAAMPEARLLVVGDGDDREALRAQADRAGLAEAITWAGRVPPADVSGYFAQAACSVDPVYDLPAMRGRSPLKIVESMALGVPVLTGDVGDRRETLADPAVAAPPAGLVVAAGDAAALADAMLQVLRDGELRARLSTGAAARAGSYLWSTLAQDWARVYAMR